MLKLRKYVGSTTALKSIGTVSEFVGAGGSFVPSSERNFRDETKRVSILLSDKDGNTELINCAKNVSDDLRSKKLTFSTLGSFPIYEIPQVDVNGDPKMIINPETGMPEEYQVDETYKETGNELDVEWKWIIEVWEGYRIGQDLYVGI